jgi:hypothetical protein
VTTGGGWAQTLAVRFGYPTNGQTYLAPANVALHAQVVDSNLVQTIQFFAGVTSLGTVTNAHGVMLTNWDNANPFFLTWSNVSAGGYTLTAVARDAAGLMATSGPVNITVSPPPPPHPAVAFYSPTNGARYSAPANLTLYARAAEGNTGVVQTVQFFAGTNSLGVVFNSNQVVVTNISSAPLFPLGWSNVAAGSYELKAIATDAVGMTATSQVVHITVTTNTPPPPIPFAIGFWYPTNGQTFTAPANVGLHAWVVDSNIVRTVQYFSGATSLGILTNTAGVLFTNTTQPNPFFLAWSNVAAGEYTLTAVATDAASLLATSPPVTIHVLAPLPHTNHPPYVRITSPPNGAAFRSPVNLPIYAYANDEDGYVTSVEFRAGTNSLGFGGPVPLSTNQPPPYHSNLFYLVWSNAPLGTFPLTAIATDNSNAFSISPPVNVTILPPEPPPTNRPAVVFVSATDPLAIEGTNCWVWAGTNGPVTNCGPKNATFTVYRYGATNTDLAVAYATRGTATNGVDYVPLPGVVTVPAGQRTALITVLPLDDGPPDLNSTVVLRLLPSTNIPATYVVGRPASAEALILDSTSPRPPTGALADGTFHLQANGLDGAWFHVEYSTDLRTWTPVCTNQAVNGSIDFLDPDAASNATRFYRTVPEATPVVDLGVDPGIKLER